MEAGDAPDAGTRATRRSARQASARAMYIEARPPLKRTKGEVASTTPVAAVNGTKETENASGDAPLKKKRRLGKDRVMGAGDDKDDDDYDDDNDDMDVDPDTEVNLEIQTPQETGLSLDSCHAGQQADHFIRSAQTTVLFEDSSVMAPSQSVKVLRRNQAAEPPRSQRVSSAKSAHRLGSQEEQIQKSKQRSIEDYQRTMSKATGVSKATNYDAEGYPKSAGSWPTQQHVNNVPLQKQPVQQRNQGLKKPIQPAVKVIHGSSPGFCWSLTTLVGFMLLSAAVVLVCQKALALQNLTKEVKVGEFSAELSALQSQFPSQRPELWKRSRIHLERHLQTTRPMEPVSLILAGGRGAERTLYCLARRLASAFAAAHNTSNVLVIDGAAVAGKDSDQVKMDIDRKLREAFGGGNQPAAVIHRLEEFPPGSTLIFYRYCDHENAAYKRVFLAFTVLLPREHLESQHSLKAVEEIVQDYIAERFLDSSSQQAFNQMDVDKLSGLWSRISHLILPVAAESQVELGGCQPSLGDGKAASEQSLFTS